MISTNFSEYVDRESVELPTVNYYTSTQLNQLFRILNGNYFEIFVIFGALYGLRRSEIIGLKWSAVDFDNSIIYIHHTVVKVRHKGNGWNLEKKDICKSKKSNRTLPMNDFTKTYLLAVKTRQEEQKIVCVTSYHHEDEEYICVDKMGYLVDPDYVSQGFRRILKKNGLPYIKFHALRHSCASGMLAQGVSLKSVQYYLGHSSYGTTDKYYSHLEISDKAKALSALSKSIGI